MKGKHRAHTACLILINSAETIQIPFSEIIFHSTLFHSATNGKHASVSRFPGLNHITFSSVYYVRKLCFLSKELQFFFFLNKT